MNGWSCRGKGGTLRLCVQGEADVTVEHITRMNIQQFRHFISNAKVAGGGFSAEKADESFAAMAPLCRVGCLVSLVYCCTCLPCYACTCVSACTTLNHVHVSVHAQSLTRRSEQHHDVGVPSRHKMCAAAT